MPKISALPPLPGPITGSEVVLANQIDGENQVSGTATMIELVAAAAAPSIQQAEDARDAAAESAAMFVAQRPSLGDFLSIAEVTVAAGGGAIALPNGLRFPGGAGNGAFIVYRIPLCSEDVANIPPGTKLRVRAEFTATAGSDANVGDFAPGFVTNVVRLGDGLGVSHEEGMLDGVLSGWKSPTFLVRETLITWDDQIIKLGGLVQFTSVGAFAGNRDVTLTGLSIIVQAMPAGSSQSAIGFVNWLERKRIETGYADRVTIGPGAQAPSLAVTADDVNRSAQTRRRYALTNGVTFAKGELKDHHDLIGNGTARSLIRYTGPDDLTSATRTTHDPILAKRNTRVAGFSHIAKNANYNFHHESAGEEKGWDALIEDVDWRHEGCEVPYVTGGSVDPSLRWTPPLGVGMSSDSRMVVRRARLTSLKGGGAYFHNTTLQDLPCEIDVEDCYLGGDDPVAADVTLSTLGSNAPDKFRMRNCVLTNGVLRYVVSARPGIAELNGADHMDFDVMISNSGNLISMLEDGGRALRIRASAAGAGNILASGPAFDALFDAVGTRYKIVPGETGRKAALIGWYDVSDNDTGGGVHGMGMRLGDCSVVPKPIVFDFSGTEIEIIFNANMIGVSNTAILATINAAIAGFGSASLVSLGERYRPKQIDHEHLSVNTGGFGIHQGTMVLSTDGWARMRNAEPTDFTGGVLNVPHARIGIALEDIRIGAVGRVQVSGWISTEQVMTNVTLPGLGDGYSALVNDDGIHGVLAYAGSTSSTLACVRESMADGQGRYVPAILKVG